MDEQDHILGWPVEVWLTRRASIASSFAFAREAGPEGTGHDANWPLRELQAQPHRIGRVGHVAAQGKARTCTQPARPREHPRCIQGGSIKSVSFR
jgi:hypothetical protein